MDKYKFKERLREARDEAQLMNILVEASGLNFIALAIKNFKHQLKTVKKMLKLSAPLSNAEPLDVRDKIKLTFLFDVEVDLVTKERKNIIGEKFLVFEVDANSFNIGNIREFKKNI